MTLGLARCCSWLHSCFAKVFHSNCTRSSGTRGRKPRRCRAETALRGCTFTHTSARAAWAWIYGHSRRSRHEAAAVLSLPWPGVSSRWGHDPHHRVTSAVSPLSGTRVQPGSAAGGATRWHQPHVPTAIPNPLAQQTHRSLPACARNVCQESVRPGSFASPAPQTPGGRLEGEDVASCRQRRDQI